MVHRLGKLAVESLFPRFCVSCGREGGLWCGGCSSVFAPSMLPQRCPFCAKKGSNRTCIECRSEVYLDGISAYVPYGNPVVRRAFSVWKYHGDRAIEKVIHGWMSAASVRMIPPIAPFYVCHVPLHEGKLRLRGFDQAAVIADWAGTFYGLPVEELLVRVRPTQSQARVARNKRGVGEFDGVFEVMPGVKVPEHVLLCDDVFTSGTTMDAAARALKEAGAKQVWGWVVARG